MKRLFILAISVFMMTSANSAFVGNTIEGNEQTKSATSGYDCFFLDLKGTLGGDKNSTLTYSVYDNGTLTFLNYTRDIRDVDFDTRTKKMTMNLYEQGTGKYLGRLVGTVTGYKGFGYSPNFRYKGTFTNYKGAKIQFNYYGKFGDIE